MYRIRQLSGAIEDDQAMMNNNKEANIAKLLPFRVRGTAKIP